MCKWGTTKDVLVWVPADLSYTGRARWKLAKIDACIADIVQALQDAGINMRLSCCGHGECLGEIILEDGRVLLIVPRGGKYEYASTADGRGIILFDIGVDDNG